MLNCVKTGFCTQRKECDPSNGKKRVWPVFISFWKRDEGEGVKGKQVQSKKASQYVSTQGAINALLLKLISSTLVNPSLASHSACARVAPMCIPRLSGSARRGSRQTGRVH
ncbi:hypothetical protein PoB_006040600 [Plakobranchus ocellatus]|uniref:Uncharacterized protein n=1 Tax=Plakobranchus ocellatus TaxID=259542 RepID=A0AAV4CQ15_9GAST|nr:hypothetical protein PoB_006040600 [Plakobranchus ocellatus]